MIHGLGGRVLVVGLLVMLAIAAAGEVSIAGTLVIGATGSNIPYLNVTTTSGPIPMEIITNGNVLGGDIVPSSLNGDSLPFMYCVDFNRNIFIPGTYDVSTTNDGQIHSIAVNNAGKVAWLLDQFALGIAAEQDQNTKKIESGALQAAIWKVIYGNQFSLNAPADIVKLYLGYYNSVGTNTAPASVSKYTWISPYSNDANKTALQGQVTLLPGSSQVKVPEAPFILLLGLGLGSVSVIAYKWSV